MDNSVKDCGRMEEREDAEQNDTFLSELQGEHVKILTRCNLLLESVREVSTHLSEARMLEKIEVRLKNLTDLVTQHQKKEEQLILPIITNQSDFTAEPLRDEHLTISGTLQELNRVVAGFDTCSVEPNKLRTLNELAERLATLSRTHFSHEENVIFWFAGYCLKQLESGEKSLS